MGNCAHGRLAFGISLPEETEILHEYDCELDEIIADHHGIEDVTYNGDGGDNSLWLERFHKVNELVGNYGVSLDYLGYWECDEKILYLNKYEYLAYGTDDVEIPNVLPTPSPDEIEKLKQVANMIGIDDSEFSPKWLLTAWYG